MRRRIDGAVVARVAAAWRGGRCAVTQHDRQAVAQHGDPPTGPGRCTDGTRQRLASWLRRHRRHDHRHDHRHDRWTL